MYSFKDEYAHAKLISCLAVAHALTFDTAHWTFIRRLALEVFFVFSSNVFTYSKYFHFV